MPNSYIGYAAAGTVAEESRYPCGVVDDNKRLHPNKPQSQIQIWVGASRIGGLFVRVASHDVFYDNTTIKTC